MNRIQQLLIENSSRPEIQQQIRESATKGAAEAGYNLWFDFNSNQVKFGTEETYNNQDAAIGAAMDYIKENVNLD